MALPELELVHVLESESESEAELEPEPVREPVRELVLAQERALVS